MALPRVELLDNAAASYVGYARNRFQGLDRLRKMVGVPILTRYYKIGDVEIFVQSSNWKNFVRLSGGDKLLTGRIIVSAVGGYDAYTPVVEEIAYEKKTKKSREWIIPTPVPPTPELGGVLDWTNTTRTLTWTGPKGRYSRGRTQDYDFTIYDQGQILDETCPSRILGVGVRVVDGVEWITAVTISGSDYAVYRFNTVWELVAVIPAPTNHYSGAETYIHAPWLFSPDGSSAVTIWPLSYLSFLSSRVCKITFDDPDDPWAFSQKWLLDNETLSDAADPPSTGTTYITSTRSDTGYFVEDWIFAGYINASGAYSLVDETSSDSVFLADFDTDNNLVFAKQEARYSRDTAAVYSSTSAGASSTRDWSYTASVVTTNTLSFSGMLPALTFSDTHTGSCVEDDNFSTLSYTAASLRVYSLLTNLVFLDLRHGVVVYEASANRQTEDYVRNASTGYNVQQTTASTDGTYTRLSPPDNDIYSFSATSNGFDDDYSFASTSRYYFNPYFGVSSVYPGGSSTLVFIPYTMRDSNNVKDFGAVVTQTAYAVTGEYTKANADGGGTEMYFVSHPDGVFSLAPLPDGVSPYYSVLNRW